jgi:hypothetical protein
MADDSGFDGTSPPSCFATRPDTASNLYWPPTQESSEVILKISGSSDSSGSPAEDAAPRSAQPWLQAARRGAEHSAADSGATNYAGCRQWAHSTRRKRGCRGHGALHRRAQERRQQRAAGQGQNQRAAQRRSGSTYSRLDGTTFNSRATLVGARAQVDSSSSIGAGGGGSGGCGGSGGSGQTGGGGSVGVLGGSDFESQCDARDGPRCESGLLAALGQAIARIAAAVQAQTEATAKSIADLTAAMQELTKQQTAMTKSVSNFLFAQRQSSRQQRPPQRQKADAKKTTQKQQAQEQQEQQQLAQKQQQQAQLMQEQQLEQQLARASQFHSAVTRIQLQLAVDSWDENCSRHMSMLEFGTILSAIRLQLAVDGWLQQRRRQQRRRQHRNSSSWPRSRNLHLH